MQQAVWPTDADPGPICSWDEFAWGDESDEEILPIDLREGGPPRHLAPVVMQVRSLVVQFEAGDLDEDELANGMVILAGHTRAHATQAASIASPADDADAEIFEHVRDIAIEAYHRFATGIDAVHEATRLGDERGLNDSLRRLEEAAHVLHVLEGACPS